MCNLHRTENNLIFSVSPKSYVLVYEFSEEVTSSNSQH